MRNDGGQKTYVRRPGLCGLSCNGCVTAGEQSACMAWWLVGCPRLAGGAGESSWFNRNQRDLSRATARQGGRPGQVVCGHILTYIIIIYTLEISQVQQEWAGYYCRDMCPNRPHARAIALHVQVGAHHLKNRYHFLCLAPEIYI